MIYSAPAGDRLLREGYRRCAHATRRAARNFYYAFAFLPAQKRRGIYAIYTFCRRCDDIVDGPGPLELKREGLARQRALVAALYEGTAAGLPPEGAALADTIRRFRIPRAYFEDFLAGVDSDLAYRRFRSFDDLRGYCYQVASVVGLMTLEVLGYDRRFAKEVHDAAIDLGLAMQLTNILRDVKEDAQRGRIYLPEAEWREYDLTEEDFTRGVVDERFRAFMAFQVGRARQHFSRAERLLAFIPRRVRACPAMLRALYSAVLDRIEAFGYDIYGQRAELPRAYKVALALLTWGQSWLLPAPKRP